MNRYKIIIENMYGSVRGEQITEIEKQSEADVRKHCRKMGNILKSITLLEENIDIPAPKKTISEIPDAEALLYEMDANNCDKIIAKEGFGQTITYTRKQIEEYLRKEPT